MNKNILRRGCVNGDPRTGLGSAASTSLAVSEPVPLPSRKDAGTVCLHVTDWFNCPPHSTLAPAGHLPLLAWSPRSWGQHLFWRASRTCWEGMGQTDLGPGSQCVLLSGPVAHLHHALIFHSPCKLPTVTALAVVKAVIGPHTAAASGR